MGGGGPPPSPRWGARGSIFLSIRPRAPFPLKIVAFKRAALYISPPMSVRIRLTRTGRKNEPSWRIAVFDSRTRRDGRYLENLGTYDPRAGKAENKVNLDKERFDHWVSNGALPTEALERLLKHCGQLKK